MAMILAAETGWACGEERMPVIAKVNFNKLGSDKGRHLFHKLGNN